MGAEPCPACPWRPHLRRPGLPPSPPGGPPPQATAPAQPSATTAQPPVQRQPIRGTAVSHQAPSGSTWWPVLASLLCIFRSVSSCSFRASSTEPPCLRTQASWGLPHPAQATQSTWPPASRLRAVQCGVSLPQRAPGPRLTCEGRALSPGPPAVCVVSICKKPGSAGAELRPTAAPDPGPHAQAARYHWWKSCRRHLLSSYASVLAPLPRGGAGSRACLGADRQSGAQPQPRAISVPTGRGAPTSTQAG